MSELFQQATEKRTYSIECEVNSWRMYKCQDCGVHFSMKIKYEDGHPYIASSTKKCEHNNYVEVEEGK